MAGIRYKVASNDEKNQWIAKGRTKLNCGHVIEEDGAWESNIARAKDSVDSIIAIRIKGHIKNCKSKH